MSEKMWKDIEIVFLKQMYIHKGAMEVCNLLHILEADYGLKEDLFHKILEKVTEKEYCVVEKIRKLDNTEGNIVFVTYKGLERLSEEKRIYIKKILMNQSAYELKCEGYTTYSEWLDVNRNRLVLEADISKIFAHALADMEFILMNKDNKNEIKEILQEAIERTKERAKKIPELDVSVAYTIVLAIYDKIQSLLGSEKLFDEVEVARKLIKSYMPERHAMAIEFI